MGFRVLVISDAHFFSPQYFRYVVNGGNQVDPPSRLSTEIALGDRKANPFFALMQLARAKSIAADALVCCGDLTTCADPTAMNLAWLMLHRLSHSLSAGEPIMTAGNHDIDSRFKTSTASPNRALRFLDPPFPTADPSAAASYWANGYCIIDRAPSARVVLVNSCSLHGYATESARQLDHGFIPEEMLANLSEDLKSRPLANINLLVCHHHPIEIELPAEDRSVITNGDELISLLKNMSPPGWLVVHGHRHLPKVHYASGDANSPTIFSAGSLAANLHLGIQGRAANQFYVIDIEGSGSGLRGWYEAWTWDQHEGEWRKGQDTAAIAGQGGFGYRPDAIAAARDIARLVPKASGSAISWRKVEELVPDFKFLMPSQREPILRQLQDTHGIEWESDSFRNDADARHIRLGRRQ